MKRTILVQEVRKMRFQEVRKMRFEQAYEGWTEGRLSQHEAAQLLGVCERSFRRYCSRYEQDGLDGLIDRRLAQVSHRRAPVDEVMAVCERYHSRYQGWSVKHFHAWYRREGGTRSYSWVKSRLQEGGFWARQTPQAPRACGVAGDAAASGCQHTPMGAGMLLGLGGNDGRCHQRASTIRCFLSSRRARRQAFRASATSS